MRTTIFLFVTALALVGCGQSAQVISNDGDKDLGKCYPGGWAECVVKLCPNGYTITVKAQSNMDEATIRCKP